MLPSVAIFKTRVYISLSLRLKVGSISEGSRASALVPATTVLLLTLGFVCPAPGRVAVGLAALCRAPR